ncbi:MAG: hypothetical protein JO208_02680, partial [Alphaproteobacteria bacterium]|nr:hypothetical protein [Alphaproteobacteria bacterium]
MGWFKVRYYTVKNGRGYWQATPEMKAAGFPASVPCGKDGPRAREIAGLWNSQWDDHRTGRSARRRWPPDSLGDAFERYRDTETWKAKAPKTKLEWERAWRDIEVIFGDLGPADITLADLDGWYRSLLVNTTIDRAWRGMKIWRAMWEVSAAFDLTAKRKDPSLAIRRQTPPRRAERWSEGEVVRLIKAMWRSGHRGLACISAIAWDSQLSPKDARTLTEQHRVPGGFSTLRAKTGRTVLATVSRRTERMIGAYLASITYSRVPNAPLFRSQGGTAFDEFTMSKAFARVRERVFPGDRRTMLDMRRSGAVEAMAGSVDPGALGAKMANSISTARDLQDTYLPVDEATVRRAD